MCEILDISAKFQLYVRKAPIYQRTPNAQQKTPFQLRKGSCLILIPTKNEGHDQIAL